MLNINEEKTNIIIEFANKKESGLGCAMPKGKIKLYKADDADNSLEFIGEDKIDHTPKDEKIKLLIGNAFDITSDFKEVNRKKINGFDYYQYECIIKNRKEETADIYFEHDIWGVWEMVTSTHIYLKKTSGVIEFSVTVPAGSEVKIGFEYKIDRRIEVVI